MQKDSFYKVKAILLLCKSYLLQISRLIRSSDYLFIRRRKMQIKR